MSFRAQQELGRVLGAYANASTQKDQAVIDAARKKIVASTRDETLNFLSAKNIGWNRADAEKIVGIVEEEGKDPTVLWNLVNGATRMSQTRGYTDERTSQDRRAGRMLNVVF